MSTNLYHISDELQNLIDWTNIYKMPRYAGGHDEQMKGLFIGAKVIAHWKQDDYQGIVATCVKIPDGRYLLYNDYFGSCSGCDAWEEATDEEVKNLCITLANSAYIFASLKDIITFLSQGESEFSYEWRECAKPLLNRINIYLFKCALLRMGFGVVSKKEDTWVLMIATNIKFFISVRGESLDMELVTSDEETIAYYADIPYLLNFPKDEIIAGVITPHINRLFGIYLDRQIRHNYMGALRGEKLHNRNFLTQIANGYTPIESDLNSLQLCPVCGKMQKFRDVKINVSGSHEVLGFDSYSGQQICRHVSENIISVRCSHCGTKFEIIVP